MGYPKAPLRVLLVDDDWDARNIYTQYLTHAGMLVETAVNGLEALEGTLAFRPDVIVMDISMPLMEGHTAAEILRGGQPTKDIPIVAFSAHGVLKRTKARVASFDAVCWKPCPPQALVDVILKAAGAGPAPSRPRRARTLP